MKKIGELLICSLTLIFLVSPIEAASDERAEIALISPWVDHHDRIETILSRLEPGIRTRRTNLEREGGRGTKDWWLAVGFDPVVNLSGKMVVLENAPYSALERLFDEQGESLDVALVRWVRGGGHLLIVGGSPSIESYAATPIELLMGFLPVSDPKPFGKRKKRLVHGNGIDQSGVFINHLHGGRVTDARVLLRADASPLLIEKRVGRGRVTTLLSGAQGGLRRDGGEPSEEFFESKVWEERLTEIVNAAHPQSHILGPERDQWPPRPPVRADALDVRFFMISHQPSPYTYAPGEAYAQALRLRRLGFTSAVFGATSSRPLDDRRALLEIADAGLRIVYYDGVKPRSPAKRFWSDSEKPPRALDLKGKDAGWDVHSDAFRGAIRRLLDGREGTRGLPLRAIQLVEEFKDGSSRAPSLTAAQRRKGMPSGLKPGDPRWIEGERIRADATDETFKAFREAGQELFPDIPQSTYWPGSYWSRPLAYGFRLSSLADAADEVLGPAYGYDSPRRGYGPETVRWSANNGWAALRYSVSSFPHLAVYGMGRPLKRGKGRVPGILAWRETAWTALAHGATGLAYWAIPNSSATDELATLHTEIEAIGLWLAALERSSAPVALVESWTSRSETGDPKHARALDQCLKSTHEALEIGFEDVDIVLEEDLSRLPGETHSLVLMGSPALSKEAARALVAFVGRGGHVFLDGDSAQRTQPGNSRFDLARESGRPAQVHSVPITLSCRAARISPGRAGAGWRSRLREVGVEPRFETEASDTAAALRGDSEIAHVYGLNHSDSPKRLIVHLGREWAGREWVDLRSGSRLTSSARVAGPVILQSPSRVDAGESVVWATVARPASAFDVQIVRDESSLQFDVTGRDSSGEVVANRYPIRFEISGVGSCAENKGVSLVLRDGQVQLSWTRCEDLGEANIIEWELTDPMTGRSWRGSDPARQTMAP